MTAKKPKPAIEVNVLDRYGFHKLKCPYCGHVTDVNNYDAGGADEDNLFCNLCNREVSRPDDSKADFFGTT